MTCNFYFKNLRGFCIIQIVKAFVVMANLVKANLQKVSQQIIWVKCGCTMINICPFASHSSSKTLKCHPHYSFWGNSLNNSFSKHVSFHKWSLRCMCMREICLLGFTMCIVYCLLNSFNIICCTSLRCHLHMNEHAHWDFPNMALCQFSWKCVFATRECIFLK